MATFTSEDCPKVLGKMLRHKSYRRVFETIILAVSAISTSITSRLICVWRRRLSGPGVTFERAICARVKEYVPLLPQSVVLDAVFLSPGSTPSVTARIQFTPVKHVMEVNFAWPLYSKQSAF